MRRSSCCGRASASRNIALVSGVSTSLPMSDPPLMPAVLVIEDEPLVRTTLAEVLQEEGFRVIQACNLARRR
jgi:hypothetical protein